MPTNFPTKTALAFLTAVAALAVVRLLAPGKGLSPAIFPDAAHLTLLRRNPATLSAAKKPLNNIQQPTTNQAGAPSLAASSPRVGSIPSHPPISPNFIDDSKSLDPFFAALQSLETHAPTVKTVTILHYGDSPTTADLITGDVRDLLQQRFGDAGRGFLLPAKPWAWYGHRGVDLADKNWQISTAVGKNRPEVYGIGGASFEGTQAATTHITLKDPNQTAIELAYESQPSAAAVAISANGTSIETIPLAAPEAQAWHTTQLPPGTKTIDLHPTGPVRLFGLNLLTGRPGVLYDSLGLNGASTSVLSNGFNAEAWQAELRHTAPALVIINYGTNESSYGPYVDKLYEPTLRTAILRIRTALPGVPILVMSPMDRGRRAGVDQIETYDTIPRIISIQRRVAAELHCAFFDTFDAMGGDGTMSRWYTGHPRLVAGDLIHPTPQGAAIVAHLFVHDLSLAYDRYLGHQSTQNTTPPDPELSVSTHRNPNPKPSAAGEPIPAIPPDATPESVQPGPKP